MTFRMSTLIPARKVWAGGLAGVAAAVIASLLRQHADLDIPADVISGGIALLVPSVAYLVPPAARDVIVKADEVARQVGQGAP
ncbi:hypothetical protein [Azospirillum argentinense]|uniref:Holin n=1 Tax=Azospirillum argentinense TaxID=2970906 RepID=A0A5B0KYQ6_9PROT|nr:hypothetical protein [Azospirillum argentinense]KAA1057145.1 hypothetical protein FH063_001313 [Azospirillum argentinense]